MVWQPFYSPKKSQNRIAVIISLDEFTGKKEKLESQRIQTLGKTINLEKQAASFSHSTFTAGESLQLKGQNTVGMDVANTSSWKFSVLTGLQPTLIDHLGSSGESWLCKGNSYHLMANARVLQQMLSLKVSYFLIWHVSDVRPQSHCIFPFTEYLRHFMLLAERVTTS